MCYRCAGVLLCGGSDKAGIAINVYPMTSRITDRPNSFTKAPPLVSVDAQVQRDACIAPRAGHCPAWHGITGAVSDCAVFSQTLVSLSVGKEDNCISSGLVGLSEGSRSVAVLPSAAVLAAISSDVPATSPWYRQWSAVVDYPLGS